MRQNTMRVGIPEEAKPYFSSYSGLQIEPRYSQKGTDFSGAVHIYLVPKEGAENLHVLSLDRTFTSAEQFDEESRRIAQNEQFLSTLLL